MHNICPTEKVFFPRSQLIAVGSLSNAPKSEVLLEIEVSSVICLKILLFFGPQNANIEFLVVKLRVEPCNHWSSSPPVADVDVAVAGGTQHPACMAEDFWPWVQVPYHQRSVLHGHGTLDFYRFLWGEKDAAVDHSLGCDIPRNGLQSRYVKMI